MAVYRYAFNDIHSCGQCSGNYSTILQTILQKSSSVEILICRSILLDLHSIVVFGGRLEEFVKYRQALQSYACKHTIISAKRRLVMRYFAFLETIKGFSRKNSSSRPQESCFEVEISFSYWCRRSLRLIFGE